MNWQAVPGYPGIEASDTGMIRRNGIEKKQSKDSKGYLRVALTVGGKYLSVYVHRLVAAAFHGEPTGPLVRHLDGAPANNIPSNLAWGDTSANIRDSVRHGTYVGNGYAARTHCKNGHEFTEENTQYRPTQGRRCRACGRERAARYSAEKLRQEIPDE